MTRLSEAQERLAQAVARIERAAGSRGGDGDGAAQAAQSLIARHEAGSRAAADRLDTAIARIKTLLDG
jgi:hypothetical protein